MLCYKDKTFCVSDCSTKCTAKLTKEIEKEASKFGLPVCCADYKCEEYQEVKK